MADVPFPRPLKLGDSGVDVEGVGRALCKAGVYVPLAVFNNAPQAWRRTFGQRKVDAVNKIRRREGWKPTGVYNEPVKYRLQDDGCFDARAIELISRYRLPVPPPAERIRAAMADFCRRAESSERLWHYTQHRPFGGLGVIPEREHYNDCSSYVILAYFWARQQTRLPVPDPSGYAYKGWGNTWDDLDAHVRVSAPFQVGDLGHYEGHVTICRKAGSASTSVWSSFGREAGPENVSLHYRSDLRFVCRPPLLAGKE